MSEEKMLEDLVEYFGGKVTSYKYRHGVGNTANETDISTATAFDIDTEVKYGGGCETCAYEYAETTITFIDGGRALATVEFDFTDFLNWLYMNKLDKRVPY